MNCDVTDVEQIHVPEWDDEDYVAWNFTKSGVFSVRSAYHMQREGSTGASTSNQPSHRGWLKLWNADIQNRKISSRMKVPNTEWSSPRSEVQRRNSKQEYVVYSVMEMRMLCTDFGSAHILNRFGAR